MISSFDAKYIVALGSLYFSEKPKSYKSYFIFKNTTRNIDYYYNFTLPCVSKCPNNST